MDTMECTQKLECTQDLYDTKTEKIDPEQIGYLGMCGTKYPILKGPNKVGRDPKTCRIVLNFNSISRQHAVVNVLSVNECMLMDLDSANKTKAQGKSLQPYIPHRLNNGDMVQFGEVFGVFRLLEDYEDDDLPMTQAFDIPCTPRVVPKKDPPLAPVPQSPVASDIDDSFLVPSLPKRSSEFKSPLAKVQKSKPATDQSNSGNVDNTQWKSRKKSDSFNLQLDESGGSINEASTSDRSNIIIDESMEDIHEMETQVPYKADDSTDSIYTANTQLPPSPSIHYMETQQPVPDIHSLDTQQQEDIHSLNTQVVTESIHDRDTQESSIHDCDTQASISEQTKECQISNEEDGNTSNKENDISIFNAETQVLPMEKEPIVVDLKKPDCLNISAHEISKDKNDSDEEIVFDDINTQSFHEQFESQPLLPLEVSPQIDKIENIKVSSEKIKDESGITDGDDFDILPTQKIVKEINSVSAHKTTDINILPTQKITNEDDEDLTDCEDEFINNQIEESKGSPELNFEDMATQVLGDDEIEIQLNQNKDETDGPSKVTSFEEMPTQVITNDSIEDNFEDQPTQIITIEEQNDPTKVSDAEVYSEEIISPFKVPFSTPLKNKKTLKLGSAKALTPKAGETKNDTDVVPNYYEATQDILQDLCSQKQSSPKSDNSECKPTDQMDDNELVPCSVEDFEPEDGLKHLENHLSPAKRHLNNLQRGLKVPVAELDTAVPKTPKLFKIINAELPDSQEIKTSVTLIHRSVTESSSDTESEEVSDQDSGITFSKKKKPNSNAKLDLTKKFEESVPTRIITRVRKPTFKIRNSDENTQNKCKSILKNSLLDSQESIDAEIISENLSRLQSKGSKKREKDSNKSKNESGRSKARSDSRNASKEMDKSNEDKTKEHKSRSSRSKSKKSEEAKSSKKESRDDSGGEKTTRSTRSSRNRRDDKSNTERNDKKESKEKDRSESKSRSKGRNDSKERKPEKETSKSKEKQCDYNELSPEIEVRRSARQRSRDNENKTAKHENSTVYMSSESGMESPKNLKRLATNELEVPSAKRTRSWPGSKSSSGNTTPSSRSICSTPARFDVQYVLFTAFSNDDVRGKLEDLGAVVVTDVTACTVLVTLQIKRTFKLLCAVGLGRPIVGPEWVQACADKKRIVDPWQYIIKDVAAEKRFKFSLEQTLRGNRNFLKGYNVSSTPSVLPNEQEMRLIVECSGGTWKADSSNWICISSSADKALWPGLRRRGATIVSTEFILGGVLRQTADVTATAMGVANKKKGEAGKGEFVCGECGRRCLSRIGLSSHARSHTRS